MKKNHSTAGKKALLAATPSPRAGVISVLSIFLLLATRKRAGQFTTARLEYCPHAQGGQSSLLRIRAHWTGSLLDRAQDFTQRSGLHIQLRQEKATRGPRHLSPSSAFTCLLTESSH